MELKLQLIPDVQGRIAPIPQYQTAGSAAMDLAAFISEDVTIQPGCRAKVPTGIAIELPLGTCALVLPRSSMGANHGVNLANGVGLIDSDYRGELLVVLQNNGAEAFTLSDGQRIAQLLVVPILQAVPVVCDHLSVTDRGTGGFGSTGKI